MKIEHTALFVFDLERTRDFFTLYFGAQAWPEYHNERTGFRSYFLSFDNGGRLEIMTRPELQASCQSGFNIGYAHIAFSVGSKEEVNQLTANLSAAGYELVSGPRVTGDGYYESCILGPENIAIEITV